MYIQTSLCIHTNLCIVISGVTLKHETYTESQGSSFFNAINHSTLRPTPSLSVYTFLNFPRWLYFFPTWMSWKSLTDRSKSKFMRGAALFLVGLVSYSQQHLLILLIYSFVFMSLKGVSPRSYSKDSLFAARHATPHPTLQRPCDLPLHP